MGDWATVVGWADESVQIAIKPEVGYCVPKNGACWYTADQLEYVPEKPEKKAAVDDGYLAAQAPVVRKRMAMAGVRLAAILNAVFKGTVVTEPQIELGAPVTTVGRQDILSYPNELTALSRRSGR